MPIYRDKFQARTCRTANNREARENQTSQSYRRSSSARERRTRDAERPHWPDG